MKDNKLRCGPLALYNLLFNIQRFACWVKILVDDICDLETFFLFFSENRILHSMQM